MTPEETVPGTRGGGADPRRRPGRWRGEGAPRPQCRALLPEAGRGGSPARGARQARPPIPGRPHTHTRGERGTQRLRAGCTRRNATGEEDARATKYMTGARKSCVHQSAKRSAGEGVSWYKLMHSAAPYHRA